MPNRPPRGRGSQNSRRDDILPLLAAARLRRRGGGGGRPKWPFVLVFLVLAIALLGGALVAGAATARHVVLASCSLDGRKARTEPQTSFVYASNGLYLGAVHAQVYRTAIAYKDMSPWVRRATVAAEDHTFWTNNGVDYQGIARAALKDLSAGKKVEGASTITQQLVRNMYLNDNKTFTRKEKEACLSIKLTRKWSKRRILAAYRNRVPYGHRAEGIEAASETYFGVHANRLGPAEAALLAGLPQAPSAYDPFVHPQAALQRRNEVLKNMAKLGTISRVEYRKAIKRPLGLHPGHIYTTRRNPNFFNYVRSQLVSVYGEQRVKNGGLKVYTTLDPREQRLARKAIKTTLYHKHDPASALVSIDPRSGAIRAIVSLYHGHVLDFNLATQGKRQTGSAFKTFVLADAVLHHADPYHTWYDSSPFVYQPTPQSKPWAPHTYENKFFGPETLDKATVLSDNVVFAKLTLDLGPKSVRSMAYRLGIKSHLQAVPSIGLGSNSVTPLELASAYATIADGGLYRRPFAVAKVVLPSGKVDSYHKQWGPAKPKRRLPKGVAYTVTRVLRDNVLHGTGIATQIPGRLVAGKTGTTSHWTDAWFAGYTRRRTTVTWVGYPYKTISMANVDGIQVQGATFPAEIWHKFMAPTVAPWHPLPWIKGHWSFKPWHGSRSMSGAPSSGSQQAAGSSSGSG